MGLNDYLTSLLLGPSQPCIEGRHGTVPNLETTQSSAQNPNLLQSLISLLQALNQQTSQNQTPNNMFSLSKGSLLQKRKFLVPGAGFEPATSGHQALLLPRSCSPDYESGAQTRLGYPGPSFLDYFQQ